jgi:hypothetical protein
MRSPATGLCRRPNAIWLAAAFAFVLGLPYLCNAAAYYAVTSIAIIGLHIAYVARPSCGCARARTSRQARGSSAGGAGRPASSR